MQVYRGQRWSPQYCGHRKVQPRFVMAQLRSPPIGDTHQAAVRFPPAEPSDRQCMVGPATSKCPSPLCPVARPRSLTSASRDTTAFARGQGWFSRHVPSISRAAIPARRMRGPSAHQIGPSPSQTRIGVQAKDSPAGTIVAGRKSRSDTGCL